MLANNIDIKNKDFVCKMTQQYKQSQLLPAIFEHVGHTLLQYAHTVGCQLALFCQGVQLCREHKSCSKERQNQSQQTSPSDMYWFHLGPL